MWFSPDHLCQNNSYWFFRWEIHVQKKESPITTVHMFDKVIFATGPFRKAVMPNIPGMKDFKGQMIHAKDFRMKSIFKNKRVIILGKLFGLSRRETNWNIYSNKSNKNLCRCRLASLYFRWWYLCWRNCLFFRRSGQKGMLHNRFEVHCL